MNDQNVFAGAFVDRSGERRKDSDWLDEAMASPDCRYVPVWNQQCLVDAEHKKAALLPREALEDRVEPDEMIFLGLFRDQPAFAAPLPASDVAPLQNYGEFRDLRFLGTVLPADEANLAAHARALVLWHESQIYCGVCGTASVPSAGGNSRRCQGASCGKEIFPRVDPAIIVLVHDGDRCLLGRQSSWPEGRYSTIAGFVEPGESLEDAVRREVYEETNVHVGTVQYHSSQPWPFPSSLMLGFTATATSETIILNDAELDDARWFQRQELLENPDSLPFRISIARRLVDHWLHLIG